MNAIQRAVALLFAASTLAFAGSAEAAVMFHAYDSNGKDTGTCAERVSGGHALKPCDKKAAAQRFTFDVNGGTGGTITQPNECLVALSWTPLDKVGGRPCNSTNFVGKLWRYTNGTQIIAMDSASASMCLSAKGTSFLSPPLVVHLCSARALLTQWGVDQVP